MTGKNGNTAPAQTAKQAASEQGKAQASANSKSAGAPYKRARTGTAPPSRVDQLQKMVTHHGGASVTELMDATGRQAQP